MYPTPSTILAQTKHTHVRTHARTHKALRATHALRFIPSFLPCPLSFVESLAQRYKPHNVEIETKLKPFIPDYIPAIGEIDHFLKIPRADGKKDNLGLTVLDEPAAQQTDPTVLDLQLRAISTMATLQPTVVPSIENASQHPQKITTWITNMSELHKSNPPPNVIYTKAMPDIEQLMQVWPVEMEEALETCELPSADLDVDAKAYARIVCALLDIPVHNTSLKESLHLLFTLYSEFKATQSEMHAGVPNAFGADGF
jgi:intraflagellar transport protein 46